MFLGRGHSGCFLCVCLGALPGQNVGHFAGCGGAWDWLFFGMGCLTGAMLRHMFVEGPRRTVVTVLGDEKLLKSFSEECVGEFRFPVGRV